MKKGVKLSSTCEDSALVVVKLKRIDIVTKEKELPLVKEKSCSSRTCIPNTEANFNLDTREGNMFSPSDRSTR